MKKILILFLILLICGCQKGYIEINYNDLYKKINSHDTYILEICNNDCNNEIIKKISKQYKLEIYYVNNLTDKQKLVIENQLFSSANLNTPTIALVENGIVKDKKEGTQKYEEILEFLKNNKMMEE